MNTKDREVEAQAIGLESISANEVEIIQNTEPDTKTKLAIADLEHERKKEEISGIKQDRKMRGEYANKIFGLVKLWLGSVGALLLISGFGAEFKFFDLDSKVLVTLAGGTTLGVVGLLATVAKYLFNEKQIKGAFSSWIS